MLPLLEKIVAKLTGFTLQSIEGFPYVYYTNMIGLYDVLEDWYEGRELMAKVTVNTKTNQQVDRYPIKINPLKGTARKHTSVLFGQNLDSIRFGGVPVRFLPDFTGEEEEGDIEANKKRGKKIRNVLTKTWADNGGGSLFVSNGIVSQYLGGCVFAAKWIPSEGRIQITAPDPREFVGIPEGTDYWRLREAWIIREVVENDLMAYGLTVKDVAVSHENKYFYIEHWTKTSYRISINDVVLLDDEGEPMEGTNPFGVVPMVYIPHIRERGFLGLGIITEAVKGLIKEMNNRYADIGDAVSDDSHNLIAVRNVRGNLKTTNVDGRTIVDLGSTVGIGNEGNPDLLVAKMQQTSTPMIEFASSVYSLYRKEVDHPAVADGEDEGSQRSSLTLSVRMWPLEAHVELERTFWTVGLVYFSKIILKMMAIKGLNNIDEEDIDVPLIIEWQPKLPRDRDALVNEVVARDSAQLGSKASLMEKLGDTPSPEEEIDVIAAEQKLLNPEPKLPIGGKPAIQQPTPPGATKKPKASAE